MKQNTLIGLVAFGLIATSGTAQAQERHWDAQSFRQSMDQKGSATGDFIYSGVKVWTKDQDAPEIRFGCSERYGLTANINFLPASQADSAKSHNLKLRQKTTNLTIGDRETERVPWTVIKETRTVQTRRSKHAAMIYNAVVQGLPITVKEPYKKTVTLTPPPADAAFTWFAENCYVTAP